MTNPVSQIRQVDDHGHIYQGLTFICPGCALDGQTGLHMLPVSGDIPEGRARWDFNGNLEAPTLSPSILTRAAHRRAKKDGEWIDIGEFVCHSFLRNGVFEYLSDCTHALSGQSVPVPPLEDWMVQ